MHLCNCTICRWTWAKKFIQSVGYSFDLFNVSIRLYNTKMQHRTITGTHLNGTNNIIMTHCPVTCHKQMCIIKIRYGLTSECSVLTILAPSFNCLVNSFNRLGYSLISSIRASSILHPKTHTYNPSTGRRHHLGSSLAVMLPHMRDTARAGSRRKSTSCRV